MAHCEYASYGIFLVTHLLNSNILKNYDGMIKTPRPKLFSSNHCIRWNGARHDLGTAPEGLFIPVLHCVMAGVVNYFSWRAKGSSKYAWALRAKWTPLSKLFLYISMYSRGDQRAKLNWSAGQIWPAGRLLRTPALWCPYIDYFLPQINVTKCIPSSNELNFIATP